MARYLTCFKKVHPSRMTNLQQQVLSRRKMDSEILHKYEEYVCSQEVLDMHVINSIFPARKR